MPSLGGTSSVLCDPGTWTSLWDGPTWGFTYVWSDRPVTIRWRRWASGVPWYMEGTANLVVGQNTLISGGPSVYLKLEVNPFARAVLRAT